MQSCQGVHRLHQHLVVIEGQNLLKTDPEKWKATYDAAVKVKAAKAGKDVTENVQGVLT